MTSILTEIISLLVGGITGIATGIGQGLNDLVSNIFIETVGDASTLSVFGRIVAIFGGIALAVSLSRKVVSFLTSLGGRRM